MQTEPTDKILEIVVAARESGVSRRACMKVVADVYAAPWSAPAQAQWQRAGAFANTRWRKSNYDMRFSLRIYASNSPTTAFEAVPTELTARGARR